MNEFELVDDEKPKGGGAKAENELWPSSSYDPLLAPWDDLPAPTSSPIAGEKEDPLFGFGRETQASRLIPRRPPGSRIERAGAQARGELRGPPGGQAVAVPRPRPRRATAVREVVEVVLLALLIFLAVRVSVQNFRVDGTSMAPSLEDNQYVIVNKLAYAKIDLSIFDWLPFFDAGEDSVRHFWSTPQRGDVIVFNSPISPDRKFIKRIIAVPGDTVFVVPGRRVVQVNGKLLEEPYAEGKTACGLSCGPWRVPKGHYFVLGDNRQNSSDSRQGWFVPEENIIGKALITYWQGGTPPFEGSPNIGSAPNREITFASDEER